MFTCGRLGMLIELPNDTKTVFSTGKASVELTTNGGILVFPLSKDNRICYKIETDDKESVTELKRCRDLFNQKLENSEDKKEETKSGKWKGRVMAISEILNRFEHAINTETNVVSIPHERLKADVNVPGAP